MAKNHNLVNTGRSTIPKALVKRQINKASKPIYLQLVTHGSSWGQDQKKWEFPNT